jgi:DNA-binding CsgD family transcriptional regulator
MQENSGVLLTTRQISILCLIARGWTTVEIGAELFISHHTVSQHVAEMLRRFGARTRSELIARAFVTGHLSAADGWPPRAGRSDQYQTSSPPWYPEPATDQVSCAPSPPL